MSDGTIAMIIYLTVLTVGICLSGIVVEKRNLCSVDREGIVITFILWPMSMFILPAMWFLVQVYKLGGKLGSKLK